jgi:GT2 family glycosyltransferase
MIAIVVITHQRVHLLRQCVEQVLGRTSPATTEIVIWDNGSTDETPEFLRALDDPRIKVVLHPSNIGQNAYARAVPMTTASYVIELDDDVVDAPQDWDRILLDAFERIPDMGYLAADVADDPHDHLAEVRYRMRPHVYEPYEVNGVNLLRGPIGGTMAITSREIYDRVGGFGERREVYWSEDEAYVKAVERAGLRAAVFADLTFRHAGGPYYSEQPDSKRVWRERYDRKLARKNAIKRVLLAVPPIRRLNQRHNWFQPPGDRPFSS